MTCTLSQFQIMAELAVDRSTWADVQHYPATVTCRRLLRLADFAAAEPARWGTCLVAWECPELSFAEVAAITGRTMTQVQRHVAPADLSDREDFTAAELGLWPGEPPPAWLTCRPLRIDTTDPSLTYRRGRSLADWAAASPVRWQVIRYAAAYPDATQPEIAAAFGVSQRTVSNYLLPFSLTDDCDDDFPEEF